MSKRTRKRPQFLSAPIYYPNYVEFPGGHAILRGYTELRDGITGTITVSFLTSYSNEIVQSYDYIVLVLN